MTNVANNWARECWPEPMANDVQSFAPNELRFCRLSALGEAVGPDLFSSSLNRLDIGVATV